RFRHWGLPLLVGPSRKSFLGEVLGTPPQDRLEGTLAAVVTAVVQGADLVRVHDVEAIDRARRVVDALGRADPVAAAAAQGGENRCRSRRGPPEPAGPSGAWGPTWGIGRGSRIRPWPGSTSSRPPPSGGPAASTRRSRGVGCPSRPT